MKTNFSYQKLKRNPVDLNVLVFSLKPWDGRSQLGVQIEELMMPSSGRDRRERATGLVYDGEYLLPECQYAVFCFSLRAAFAGKDESTEYALSIHSSEAFFAETPTIPSHFIAKALLRYVAKVGTVTMEHNDFTIYRAKHLGDSYIFLVENHGNRWICVSIDASNSTGFFSPLRKTLKTSDQIPPRTRQIVQIFTPSNDTNVVNKLSTMLNVTGTRKMESDWNPPVPENCKLFCASETI